MDVSERRVGTRSSTVVAAGSVWESRMKSDEVRGGIKVFNGDDNSEEAGGSGGTGTRVKRIPVGGVGASGRRKAWKSESSEGTDKTQIQIARGKPESQQKNCDEQCKELSISSDGIKKSPIQARKLKTEGAPIHARKPRSEIQKDASESSEGPERSLRKSKSDSIRTANQNVKPVGENNPIQLRKTKSASNPVLDESSNGINGGIEKISGENVKDDNTNENCKDFEVCEEKLISSSSENVSVPKCSPELSVLVDGNSDGVVDDEAEADEDEKVEAVDEAIETEMEKESFDVKEISIPPEPKIVKEPENNKVMNELEKKVVVKIPENNNVVNELEKKVVVKKPANNKVVNELEKEVVVKEPEKKDVIDEPEKKKSVNVNQPEHKRLQSTHRRFQQNNERPVSIPAVTGKQAPPVKRHSTIYQNFSKYNSNSKEYHSFPQTQSKMQSLVDLILWRDISRSAFVFGIGTFIIISSSYAKDINVSFISVISYLGLVYLALIFLYRSLICRGIIDSGDTNYVLGEEEATWVLKLILPYLNELLSKFRALFSGDPGTTMKLAVLLFVLARCGSSITIWKMAKFGFFGVFTVPKICSSYSAQLTAYANFWVRRFRDAWDSCSHKKAVALGIFGLVWNLSSVVARVWAVFVLFVAFRYYQQHYMVRDEYVAEEEEEEEEGCEEETWQATVGGKSQARGHIPSESNKLKKGF